METPMSVHSKVWDASLCNIVPGVDREDFKKSPKKWCSENTVGNPRNPPTVLRIAEIKQPAEYHRRGIRAGGVPDHGAPGTFRRRWEKIHETYRSRSEQRLQQGRKQDRGLCVHALARISSLKRIQQTAELRWSPLFPLQIQRMWLAVFSESTHFSNVLFSTHGMNYTTGSEEEKGFKKHVLSRETMPWNKRPHQVQQTCSPTDLLLSRQELFLYPFVPSQWLQKQCCCHTDNTNHFKSEWRNWI